MENVSFKELMDNLYDGVYLVDANRIITFWNKAAEKITGYSSEEVIGKGCFDNILVHVDENGHALCHNGCPLKASIADGVGREINAFLRHRDGYRLPVLVKVNAVKDVSGQITGGVESFNDNSPLVAIRERAADLEQMALIDPLTGVGNRRYGNMSLSNKLSEFKRYGWTFGVLFLDIDHFKQVNDTYGHSAGDEVLKMVAQTMLSNMRSFDFVFRWGGEEFLIIITNVDGRKLRQSAERLRVMIQNASHKTGQDRIKVTVSIGGTMASALDTEYSILSRIDNFMYQCKGKGRNQCIVDGISYNPDDTISPA
jgi:diguanylate cyclase (GGDEF)-like protein/PAS domain S-box-containing protein